jgi:hypothetical protein
MMNVAFSIEEEESPGVRDLNGVGYSELIYENSSHISL